MGQNGIFLSLFGAALMMTAPVSSAQSDERPQAILFDGAGLSGAPQPIFSPLDNLSTKGFNNRASSIDVHAGTWEICSDKGFRGTCHIIETGAHDLSQLALDNKISSMRPVEGRAGESADAAIILHTKTRQRGRARTFTGGPMEALDKPFNNRAASITVQAGTWEVCADPGFRGRCAYLTGSVDNLKSLGLSARISSFRPVTNLRPAEAYDLVLFPERNHQGSYRGIDGAVANLNTLDFNDRTQSILVNSGEWLVCEDRNFRGRCEVVGASARDLSKLTMATRISSVRPHVSDTVSARIDPLQPADPLSATLLGGDYGGMRHEGAGIVFFPNPEIDGTPVDYCRDGDTSRCGNAAGDAFCRQAGHSGIVYFSLRKNIANTVAADGLRACSGGQCRALADVVCTK